jgi:putative sterol carrier protein
MTPQRKVLVDEIATIASRVASLVRDQPTTNIPIRGTSWSIGDAAAHLIISQILSRKIFQGEKNPYRNARPETIAAMNAQLLSEFHERDGAKLATLLTIETDNLLKEINRHEDSYTVRTHFGEMDLLTVLSYNLCHVLIHGCAVALALKKPLPIEEEHIAMTFSFLKLAMHTTFNKEAAKDFTGSFAIHLRNSVEFSIVIKDQSISIQDSIIKDGDCHLYADSIAYFLMSTGVISPWRAVLQRKVKVSGKKPWIIMKLPKLFETP